MTTCGNTATTQLILFAVAVAVAMVSPATALPVSEMRELGRGLNITDIQKNLKCSVDALYAVTKPSIENTRHGGARQASNPWTAMRVSIWSLLEKHNHCSVNSLSQHVFCSVQEHIDQLEKACGLWNNVTAIVKGNSSASELIRHATCMKVHNH